jgi:hypothetical protein
VESWIHLRDARTLLAEGRILFVDADSRPAYSEKDTRLPLMDSRLRASDTRLPLIDPRFRDGDVPLRARATRLALVRTRFRGRDTRLPESRARDLVTGVPLERTGDPIPLVVARLASVRSRVALEGSRLDGTRRPRERLAYRKLTVAACGGITLPSVRYVNATKG